MKIIHCFNPVMVGELFTGSGEWIIVTVIDQIFRRVQRGKMQRLVAGNVFRSVCLCVAEESFLLRNLVISMQRVFETVGVLMNCLQRRLSDRGGRV